MVRDRRLSCVPSLGTNADLNQDWSACCIERIALHTIEMFTFFSKTASGTYIRLACE